MNSRERILTTLQHKEPDRIPIDLGGIRSTGISIKAYEKLKNYLRLKGGDIEIYDFFQQIVRPDQRILKKIGADVYAIITNPSKNWKLKLMEDEDSYSYIDEWGIKYKMAKKGGWCYYMVNHPLVKVKKAEELDDYNWPDPYDPGIMEGLKEKVKDLYHNTNYALLANSPTGGILEHSQALRGFDTFLMDMLLNPELAMAIMDKVLEFQMGFWDNVLGAIGKYVQIVQIGDDLGSERGPLISLDLYKKLLKPKHKELCQFIKKKANAYLLLHACGSVSEFIPDFIDNGIDILNPIQTSAKNMDTKALKKEYGDRITFWGGGCDTQRILPYGTEKEVEEEVRMRVSHLGPGGGFVFTQVHNITAEVPPKNIIAMYKAVKKYGKYPLR